MLVKDVSEFSPDALLNEIKNKRGEDEYELYILG